MSTQTSAASPKDATTADQAVRRAHACKQVAALLTMADVGGERSGQALAHADVLLRGIEQQPQADGLERSRKLAELETTLLALDEQLGSERFEAMLEGIDQEGLLAYGRLLASRPLTPGQRADRFEVIARRLLTTRRADGRFRVRPAIESTPLLEALLQALPTPRETQRKEEVLAQVTALRERVLSVERAEDLGQLYGDVRRGCVQAAEWLVDADVLLLAINLEVQLHNKIEGFIMKLEIHQRARPSFLSGNPREYIEAAIDAQERRIAHALKPQPPPEDIARLAHGQTPAEQPQKPPRRARKSAPQRAPATATAQAQKSEVEKRPPLRKMLDYVNGLPRGSALAAMAVINLLSIAIIVYALVAL